MNRTARQLLALSILLLAWEGMAALGLLNPLYAPSPRNVLATLIGLFADGEIWRHLRATFSAALWGLGLGVVTGGTLGLVAALVPRIEELVEPVVLLLNAIPRVILAPLFVIWFGIGLSSKIALAFILVSVLFFFAVHAGIRDVNPNLVARVRTLGGHTRTLIQEVYLPAVSSRMISQLKIAVGFAFTGAVVGEFVASSRGLGYVLSFAQSTYNAPLTLGLILLVMAFVLVMFATFNALERRLLLWKNPDSRSHVPNTADARKKPAP